jgi:Ser/Thr protein kinase RdoA (MazF antagonist)
MRDLLPVFSDEDKRKRLECAVDDFEQSILPVMASLPAQIIHNDFNMENILVDPAAPDTITGIIDFGDMVHAPRLFDVAVGAAYQMGTAEDPIEAMCDFLKGYSSLQKLTEIEVKCLYPAVVMRMVMRVTITEWRARLFPENYDFYTRNSPSVWLQFARLDTVSKAQAVERLTAACQ